MVLAAETRKYCSACRFLDHNRRRIAISLSKTALEARFGALEGDIRRLSAHAHIGFESPLTTKRCSSGVGRFQLHLHT
jgi:hypothetical protein